jgi:hypothetical protein
MKFSHWIVIALMVLVVWAWWRLRNGYGTSGVTASAGVGATTPTAEQAAVVSVAQGQWPGSMDLNPLAVSQADQTKYPGWYKTADGGWVKPETGEFYSPGASPPIESYGGPSDEAVAYGEYLAGVINQAQIDAQAGLSSVVMPEEGYVIR